MNCLTLENLQALRAVLRRKIRNAEASLENLRALMADVGAAERLLKFMASEECEVGEASCARSTATISARNPYRSGSMKSFIWEALDHAPEPWLTTAEVRDLASEFGNNEFAITSIAPALSDMKAVRLLLRNGLKVALVARVIDDNDPATIAALRTDSTAKKASKRGRHDRLRDSPALSGGRYMTLAMLDEAL